jgi:hypothetical protein
LAININPEFRICIIKLDFSLDRIILQSAHIRPGKSVISLVCRTGCEGVACYILSIHSFIQFRNYFYLNVNHAE